MTLLVRCYEPSVTVYVAQDMLVAQHSLSQLLVAHLYRPTEGRVLQQALPESRRRLRVAALDTYARELADVHGVKVSRSLVGSGQPLLRLAVNLPTNKEADDAISRIAAAGLYAVPWYRPLLYPGVSDPDVYGFDGSLGGLPNTAALTRGAVALPCDLSPARVHDVAKALRGAVVTR